MWASAIVKGQISANADAGFGYGLVGVEVDFFVFDRTPEPFDEHVVPPRTLAVHRDGNLSLLQHGGEVDGGELRSLVGVEDFGPAVTRASSTASIQKSASIVIDNRHDRTRRLNQSTTAQR